MSTANCILSTTNSNSTSTTDAAEPAALPGSRSANADQFGALMDNALARNSGGDASPAETPDPKANPAASAETMPAADGEKAAGQPDSPPASIRQDWRPNLGPKGEAVHWLRSPPPDYPSAPTLIPAATQPASLPVLPPGESAPGGNAATGTTAASTSQENTAAAGDTGSEKHSTPAPGSSTAAELLVASMTAGWIQPTTPQPVPAATTPKTADTSNGSAAQKPAATSRSSVMANRGPAISQSVLTPTGAPATASPPAQSQSAAASQRPLQVELAAAEVTDALSAATPQTTAAPTNRPTPIPLLTALKSERMNLVMGSDSQTSLLSTVAPAAATRAIATTALTGETDNTRTDSSAKTAGPASDLSVPLTKLSENGAIPVAVTSSTSKTSAADQSSASKPGDSETVSPTSANIPSPVNAAAGKTEAPAHPLTTNTRSDTSNPPAASPAAGANTQTVDTKSIAEASSSLADTATVAGPSPTEKGSPQAKPGPTALFSAQIGPKTPVAEGSEAHGTSAAKQYATMKNPEKTSNVAGGAEQELPVKSEVMPREEISPSASLIKTLPDHQDAANALSSATPYQSTVTASSGVPIIALPVTDLRVSALERTHDMVALHALRLSNSNSDSLHVVIKPGAGVQLSLELRQKADGLEVQAQLHRGDMEFFRQHWTELQDRLEPRGVRLADLTSSDNFVGTGTNGFAQSQQHQAGNEDPLFAGAFAEFAMADFKGAPAEQRAAQAASYRGWESWA